MLFLEFENKEKLLNAFPTERDCIDYLETLRWNGSIVSPFYPKSIIYTCKEKKYKCRTSGKYFNVKTNTIFHNTKIDLRKWFLAIWIVSYQNKAINSVALSKELKVTQKSAWYMIKRIKLYLKKNDNTFENKNHFPRSDKNDTSIYRKPEKLEENDKLSLLQWLQLMKN